MNAYTEVYVCFPILSVKLACLVHDIVHVFLKRFFCFFWLYYNIYPPSSSFACEDLFYIWSPISQSNNLTQCKYEIYWKFGLFVVWWVARSFFGIFVVWHLHDPIPILWWWLKFSAASCLWSMVDSALKIAAFFTHYFFLFTNLITSFWDYLRLVSTPSLFYFEYTIQL